jgi:hypothetical protein
VDHIGRDDEIVLEKFGAQRVVGNDATDSSGDERPAVAAASSALTAA